jgi:serine/threonine-protein kinase PRP4
MFSASPSAVPLPAVDIANNAAGALAEDDVDDAAGYYVTRIGDIICDRYQVTSHLGAGVFASVVRCVDLKGDHGAGVAVKLIRSNDTMTKAATQEVAILQKLNSTDPNNRRHIIKLLFDGSHLGHTVLAFEGLSLNLREVLNKFGAGVGIAVGAVRRYARQLFIALNHMSKHKVVHADIKPDNILVSADYSIVKICDMGSAMFTTGDTENEPTPYLISRFYRAPEIILGLQYGQACDLWSIGVTLFELYAGRVMFPGSTNNDMLRRIMAVKGPFAKKMVKRHIAQYTAMGIEEKLHFVSDGEGKFLEQGVDKVTGRPKVEEKTIPLVENEIVRLLVKKMGGGKDIKKEKQEVIKLGKMLESMLTLDSVKRPIVAEVMKSEFVSVPEEPKPGAAAAAVGAEGRQPPPPAA